MGYGAQPIYKFNAKLTINKKVEAELQAKAGLRSIVLRRDLDQWGRSFEINVNGIPIFGKGADVIPFDSFPSRVTTAQYRQVLESAREANMNMIRHWGGGYYETEEFYDICDELGIMIWQDFMFGNDWQPGTYAFKQEVEREAEFQVKRLRNHPSIVLWSGNNETEAAVGWKGRSDLPADVRYRMWQDYLTVFSGVLDRTVNRLNPETPYWPSSPSADYEELSDTYQSGDMHDWSVWHGRVPFTEYEKHFPRFMTEFGFQSFPEMRTIETFTQPEDRTSIFTPVMLTHQKNDAGNSIIRDYMTRYYGTPKDFSNFLYASQVLQAEAMKIGAEHLRRTRPRAMGSHLLATERLLAGCFVGQPGLLRAMEGSAVLRETFLQPAACLSAYRGRNAGHLRRLRQDNSNDGAASHSRDGAGWQRSQRRDAADCDSATLQPELRKLGAHPVYEFPGNRPRENLCRSRPGGWRRNCFQQHDVFRRAEACPPAVLADRFFYNQGRR